MWENFKLIWSTTGTPYFQKFHEFSAAFKNVMKYCLSFNHRQLYNWNYIENFKIEKENFHDIISRGLK